MADLVRPRKRGANARHLEPFGFALEAFEIPPGRLRNRPGGLHMFTCGLEEALERSSLISLRNFGS